MSEPARLFDPGEPEERSGRQVGSTTEPTVLKPGERVVRVLPDVSGLDREFDYLVPADLAQEVGPGSLVRVDLHGRRVAAWVIDVDVVPDPGLRLRPIARLSSIGPSADMIDLARWAATRWSGRLAAVLKSASPPRMVRNRPRARPAGDGPLPEDRLLREVFTGRDVVSVRVGPADDQFRFVEAAADLGNALVLVPAIGRARWLSGRLSRLGHRVHLQPTAWSGGASGGVVIGSRSAVWAPTAPLRSVVVLDEHDESLQEERVPTWHGRDVAIERARRAGVPCVLVSPAPSLAGLAASDRVVTVSRAEERRGWPAVEIIDRRDAEPGRGGLFSSRVADLLRAPGGAVAVLNRKGRAKMLACGSCGELVKTEDGRFLMIELDGRLLAPQTGETRPLVCAVCAGTHLKRLRLGVTRAAEELRDLVRRPVVEVAAGGETAANPGADALVLGTEAALHSVARADTVVFLDFDQELHAPRYRAAEQAMGLLVRAARLVGGRRPDARIVIQTRSPDHRVLQAALHADPGRLIEEEEALRRSLALPPFGAVAEIGGAGAADYAAAVPPNAAATILGPRDDGRYLVRADDPATLADVLAATPRPKARIRIAVDPPRI